VVVVASTPTRNDDRQDLARTVTQSQHVHTFKRSLHYTSDFLLQFPDPWRVVIIDHAHDITILTRYPLTDLHWQQHLHLCDLHWLLDSSNLWTYNPLYDTSRFLVYPLPNQYTELNYHQHLYQTPYGHLAAFCISF